MLTVRLAQLFAKQPPCFLDRDVAHVAGLEAPLRRAFASIALPASISPDFLGHNLALAIAVGAVLLWNFFVNRYWTYNDVDS